MLQAGLQDVSGEDVSDALLLSGQRLEAERALFQERMQSCIAQLSSKASEAGPAQGSASSCCISCRAWSWHGMGVCAWPCACLHAILFNRCCMAAWRSCLSRPQRQALLGALQAVSPPAAEQWSWHGLNVFAWPGYALACMMLPSRP